MLDHAGPKGNLHSMEDLEASASCCQEAQALKEEFREHWHVEVGSACRVWTLRLPWFAGFSTGNIFWVFSRVVGRAGWFQGVEFQHNSSSLSSFIENHEHMAVGRASWITQPATSWLQAPLAMRQILEEVLDPEARRTKWG